MEPDYLHDPEFQKLTQQYLDYLRDSVSTVKENLENNNYEPIQKFGHNIKGSGAGYGFPNLTKIGKEIEFAAKDHDHQKISGILPKLEAFLATQIAK